MKLVRQDAPLARWLLLAGAASLATSLVLIRQRPAWPSDLLGPCPLLALSGVRCPTCGATRALGDLAHGHWLAAVQQNPLVVIAASSLCTLGLVAAAMTAVRRWRRSLGLTDADRRRGWWLAAILVAANWLWVALR
ncbi:MAG: DUF2752 domain-containing protein [Candidatus Krumholzibacteriia bacterium]